MARETGRTVLKSTTGGVLLRAKADRPSISATDGDLAHITLALTDAVSGPGALVGFGSADPATEERFDATERHTYDGRALAILRPTGTGKIHLVATAADDITAETLITVEDQ